jgi:uncharacterized protein (DUF1015 family)
LKPEVGILPKDVADALKSFTGQHASLHSYENASGIQGKWTEFYMDGNWYMISISHVDVPTHISQAELEMLSDNFLSQQANINKRRRRSAFR